MTTTTPEPRRLDSLGEQLQQQAERDYDTSQAKEFPDTLTDAAYQQYMRVRDAMPFGSDSTPESMAAAVALLGRICDYYLNKQEGDFIRIKPSDTWQR